MGLKIFFILVAIMTLANLHSSCSLIEGFNFPTPLEQADLAATIIYGTVSKISGKDTVNRARVTLQKASYLKGKGPRRVHVDGWSNSAACGMSAPTVGEKVIVFVCPTVSKKLWNFNKFTVFTGAIYITSSTKNIFYQIRNFIRKQNGCSKCRGNRCRKCIIPAGVCKKRPVETDSEKNVLRDTPLPEKETIIPEEDQEKLNKEILNFVSDPQDTGDA